jgi:hypothetical protein
MGVVPNAFFRKMDPSIARFLERGQATVQASQAEQPESNTSNAAQEAVSTQQGE